MSIIKSIERAYSVMDERNWETIYWCIDLHGVCLKSNYTTNQNEWINNDALECLQLISSLPESKIILWSSCYPSELMRIRQMFKENNITVDFFNKNTDIHNTNTGNFNRKFYFSVLLDDKAGFDPETDWREIYEYLINKQW